MRSLRRDLLERRLWPIVVLIIAAIVAVPFVLHGPRGQAAIAPPPVATGSPQPTTSGTRHRAVDTHAVTAPTSRTRDPFQEGDVQRTTVHETTTATTSTTTPTSQSPPRSSVTTTPAATAAATTTAPAPTTAATTTAPATTTPVTSKPPAVRTPTVTKPRVAAETAPSRTRTWDVYSVDLRIGAPGHPVTHRDIARLTPLPSERAPQAMYMGVTDHGRRAVFALGAGVEVRAIGANHSHRAVCTPSRVDCALVVIPADASIALRYVSSTGPQHTLLLRLRRITTRLTRSAVVAKAARRHVSAVGLCELKLGDPIGFFDPSDETVRLPSRAACRSDKRAVPFPGSLGAGSSVRG
jgi:hypothetical protein